MGWTFFFENMNDGNEESISVYPSLLEWHDRVDVWAYEELPIREDGEW